MNKPSEQHSAHSRRQPAHRAPAADARTTPAADARTAPPADARTAPPTETQRAPRLPTRDADARIMLHAERQHGLVTRTQLLRAGLTTGAVEYRVKANRLRPIQRGVYLVGPLIAPHVREMAAVLACGPGAVVSHQSAAALWLLLPRPDDAPVDVIPHAGDRGRRADIRAHRVPRLAAEDVTGVDGIPVTTPARTLLDLAAVVSLRELEQALAQAERRQLATDEDLMAVIERNPTRRGVRVLRRLLERGATPAFTRSDAEARFLALIRRAQLPDPEVNVMFAGYEIDFLWRSERLAVEIDGFAFHGARSSFERDRRRDAQLSARGLHVIRVTWRQIVREPEAVLVRTAQTLARCGFRQ